MFTACEVPDCSTTAHSVTRNMVDSSSGDWEMVQLARSGCRMPAEWERQQRIWMGWPQRPDVWRENAGPAQQAWVQVDAFS